MAREQRKLAAILFADVVGSSRLMGRDESGTVARLLEHLNGRLAPAAARCGGRVIRLTGDGGLVEFGSAVDALRAAIEFQQAMAEANRDQREGKAIVFRIGLHLGDVIVEGDDIYGDAVNVAARLEAEAPPGGIIVSRAVREAVQGRLKADLHALGELTLKNIERPIRAFRVDWDEADWQAAATSPARHSEPDAPTLDLPDKPSIAVLPFANMSGDPEQEYFADGMVEEIITALSRIRWLFVIARNSSFTYKGHAVDVKQVGRELGVRYVLEGSVRKAGGRVRITAQLIDAQSGAHLWADRFDGSLEDVFELQDKVASSVAGVIEPALQAAETARSADRATTDLSAYDLYLRALAALYPISREHVSETLGLLEQAIAIDRCYGPALSWAAICHMRLVNDGWADNAETSRDTATDLARQALQVAQNDPGTLANAAQVLAYFGENIDAMIALVDRALALNPSFARGWFRSGVLRIWAGQPDLAIEHIEISLRLSPRERMGQPLVAMGLAYLVKRQFDEAAAKLLLSIQDHPGYPNSYRALASCYAHMGRLDEARAIVARLRAITSQVVPSDLPYRNPEHRELYLSGLRLAAGEAP